MDPKEFHEGRNDYLKRLPPEYYRGQAYVHWTMPIHERKAGWLSMVFYYKFREILTHTMFRYALCCPIYCCMPDHFHFIWMGILSGSDQRSAVKYFRKQLNLVLKNVGVKLQKQSYDHVLREEERIEAEFANVVEYIARNPERANLVKEGHHSDYKFSGCIVPGYPELKPFETDFWDRFWRIYNYLQQHGITRLEK